MDVSLGDVLYWRYLNYTFSYIGVSSANVIYRCYRDDNSRYSYLNM